MSIYVISKYQNNKECLNIGYAMSQVRGLQLIEEIIKNKYNLTNEDFILKVSQLYIDVWEISVTVNYVTKFYKIHRQDVLI